MYGIEPESVTTAEVRSMLAETDAAVLVVGHTHQPFELVLPGWGAIVNPGAVLRDPEESPWNEQSTGTFMVLELPSGRRTLHEVGDGAELELLRRRL